MNAARITLTTAILAGLVQAQSGGFRSGDLYLYSPAIQGPSSGGGAIVRVDFDSGDLELLVDLETASSSYDQMAYDPWRDRLIFFGGIATNHAELYLCDADGNLDSLGFGVSAGPSIGRFAPRGDGIIYMHGYHASGAITYLDAANQLQTLMNAGGTAAYSFPGGFGGIRQMEYDPTTNALLAVTSAFTSVCDGGDTGAVNVRRLDLSVDGSRVVGETCFQFDATSGFQEVPVGLGRGPAGDFVMVIDNNSSGTFPRVARIDPVAGTASSFASNDWVALSAGCYSQVLGRAVVLEAFWEDALLTYGANEIGDGALLAEDASSGGSSGEIATLVEVVSASVHYGLAASPSSISLGAGGSQNWSLDLGPDHAGDLYLVGGAITGWNPGFFSGAVPVPLAPDAYLTWTLSNPNNGVLANTFANLDGSGAASASLNLPPGSPAVLVGAVLHHAAVTLDAQLAVTRATNAVSVELTL